MRTLEENRLLGDSWHDIAEDVKLRYGAELHRFTNRAGVEISAIYVGNKEALWSRRKNEDSMIRAWRKHGKGIVKIIQGKGDCFD